MQGRGRKGKSANPGPDDFTVERIFLLLTGAIKSSISNGKAFADNACNAFIEGRDRVLSFCLSRLPEHINMNYWNSSKHFFLTAALFVVLTVMPARATEVVLGSARGKAGGEIQLPLSLDKTDNMAGVKIVLAYDPDMLEFLKADKTEKSQGLMHMVNATVPGRIVLVMAGATGIAGENLMFCNLYFRIRDKPVSALQTQIRIVEAEAKSDQLKNIHLGLQNGVVVIDN